MNYVIYLFFYSPEYLAPEENFNPITHRLNKAITTRALNEKSAIPDLDKRFSPQFELNQDIAARISGVDEEIIKHFGVEKGKARLKNLFEKYLS